MICVPIIAKTTEEAFEKITRANALADMMEFRLDLMESFCLEDLLQRAVKPAIVTYRSEEQGGKGRAGYEAQTRYLLDAIEAGADFVDVEYSMPPEFRRIVFQAKNSSKLIISRHPLNEIKSVQADVLIHTTPVGTYPNIGQCIIAQDALHEEMAVMDIVYNPIETRLLRVSGSVNCLTINGLGMFVHQGAEQFRLWTGLDAPLGHMAATVKKILGKHS